MLLLYGVLDKVALVHRRKFWFTPLLVVFQGNLQDSRHSSLLGIWLVLDFIFCLFHYKKQIYFLAHIIAEYKKKKDCSPDDCNCQIK